MINASTLLQKEQEERVRFENDNDDEEVLADDDLDSEPDDDDDENDEETNDIVVDEMVELAFSGILNPVRCAAQSMHLAAWDVIRGKISPKNLNISGHWLRALKPLNIAVNIWF